MINNLLFVGMQIINTLIVYTIFSPFTKIDKQDTRIEISLTYWNVQPYKCPIIN